MTLESIPEDIALRLGSTAPVVVRSDERSIGGEDTELLVLIGGGEPKAASTEQRAQNPGDHPPHHRSWDRPAPSLQPACQRLPNCREGLR